jgi:hypothetical protein
VQVSVVSLQVVWAAAALEVKGQSPEAVLLLMAGEPPLLGELVLALPSFGEFPPVAVDRLPPVF